jgi:nitrous oxide reductase accessory protein NosL
MSVAVLLWAPGCSRSERDRCVRCGMLVRESPRWNAGITGADGEPRVFDAPQCLLRWLRGSAGRGARGAWVRDYYGQRRVDAESVYFVTGSDVLGPMGHDLVPLATREEADRFGAEHRGRRILRFREIDRTVLRHLGP